jgi:hypothetical protein
MIVPIDMSLLDLSRVPQFLDSSLDLTVKPIDSGVVGAACAQPSPLVTPSRQRLGVETCDRALGNDIEL